MEADEGERVTVRVSSRRPVRAKLVDESPPGFAVDATGLDAALSRSDAGLRLAASRHGEELTVTVLDQLVGRLDGTGAGRPRGDLTVAFGAPERGLPAILGEDPPGGETGDDRRFDRWLNTVPDQGSEVVRTEEALFATLAPLRLRK
jgi:predicted SPOUT superfamily RNA methylase MTH1